MVAYYDHPKGHWVHLYAANIVESPFNVARLRTNVSRCFKKVENAEAMIWKLLTVVERMFTTDSYSKMELP